jgi:hypothetical protein
MAFNGTGTFLRIYNWVTDKTNGVPITASRMDAELDGMATALSTCITKDGQTIITANIPLNSNKITGLGNGTARTDVINVGQVQDNQFQYLGTTGGSADAYTLAPSPAITAYATTQQITAKISATNLTITPYLQVSAIANPATTAVIKKLSATKTEIAVEASDLLINGIYHFQRNSANDAWIVLNPEKSYFNLINATKATTTTQGISFSPNPITIANNATDANNDIDFSAGNFDQVLATAMTKRLDATWSAGSGNGGLFNGTAVPKAINSTYHCYKIYNPTTGAEDAGFLLGISGTAPDPTSVLPSGYTKFERRGSIITDGSGNIIPFTQTANNFMFKPEIADLTGVSQSSASETPRTLTLPAGISTRVYVDFYTACSGAGASAFTKFYDASKTQATISNGAYSVTSIVFGTLSQSAISNLSSQIKSNQVTLSGAPTVNIYLTNNGYTDLTLKF